MSIVGIGFLASVVLFVLQIMGVISISALAIWAPFLVALGIAVVWFVILMIISFLASL